MAASNVSELYLACRNGDQPTVARLLLTTPMDILNRLEPNGSTCLHAASYHGHKEIVRLLLAHGACRRVTNRYGCTALDEAKTEEIAELFRRSAAAAKKRFSDSPAQQPEWLFANADAETLSRAVQWGCMKDRGIKKTVKKIRKANVFGDGKDKDAQTVAHYFTDALENNNPISLLKAYTVESQFYKEFDSSMATGSRREVFEKLCRKWTGYYTGFIVRNSAFDPYRFKGETYRGMEITPSDFAQYKVGVALTNKSFQSTSKSWKIAKSFACPEEPRVGRKPVILIFTITDPRSALSIEDISEFQREEEVLIAPGTFFIVEHVNDSEVPCEVHITQLKWENEYRH